MRKLFLILLLFSSTHLLHAQAWVWGNGSTGAGGEEGGAAIDKSNNILVTGYSDAITYFGAVKIKYNVVFLVKYNSQGKQLWCVYPLGNTGSEGDGIAINNLNQIYLTGYFAGGLNFGPVTLNTGSNTFFLAKYDSNGHVLWAKQAASNSSINHGASIEAGKSGNIFVSGFYSNTAIFGKDTLSTLSNCYNGFLAKYDSSGNIIWIKDAKLLNTNTYLYEQSIALDQFENIYVTGYLMGEAKFGNDTLKSPGGLGSTAFVLKYDSTGNLIWAKQAYGTGYGNGAYAIAVDKSNNPCFTGWFYDSLRFGSYTTFSGDSLGDIFIIKLDPSGNVIWANRSHLLYNGFGDGWTSYSIATDATRNIYISGGLDTPASVVFGNDTLTSSNSNNDGSFIVKFDSSGNYLCGSLVGCGGDDGNNVVCDNTGNYIYFAGDAIHQTIFGKDTIQQGGGAEQLFAARWADCMSSKISSIKNSCADSCSGSIEAVPLGGAPPYTYAWNTVPVQTTQTATNLCAGTYSVTITDAGQQVSNETATISKLPPFPINVCCDTTISNGASVTLSSSPSYTYQWTPTNGLSCISCQTTIASPTSTTTYYIRLTDSLGCSERDSVTINVKKEDCGTVFIPDAFSPNGDGQNDVLYVRGICIKEMDFVVYDRWGNKVFESTNPTLGWDGRYNGKAMNSETFAYTLRAILFDGTTLSKQGNVALIR